MTRNKYFIAGAALVVGVLVVYFAVSGFPPTTGEVAGTMAGADTTIAGVEQAERYRADAISETDVQLDDQAINDLLQDPDVVALLQDEQFRNALSDGSMADALREPQFAEVMRLQVLGNAVREFPDFRQALLENNVKAYFLKNNAMARFEHYDKLRVTFGSDQLTAALQSAALRNFLAGKSTPKLDYAMARSLQKANFMKAMDAGALSIAAADENYLRQIDARF